uniref:Chromate transporter n=1 Tax=Globisporangium ultimum (strain ATCC 200006 / CBS 805.95 / DAOM BR144) TaxID=431595 RepID=K3WLX7_GLOUD
KARAPTEHDALLASEPEAHRDQESYWRRLLSVPVEIIPISLFSFGGPPAHLALAHDHFVFKKHWVSDARFLEVLSIASALPGPSSTQVITSMGLLRAGPLGGLLALVFWMLPGFAIMTLAGIGAKNYLHDGLPVWMSGFAPAAVSLVVIAAVRLWQKAVGDDSAKSFVAALSSCVILATQGVSSAIFPIVLATGGLTILLLNLMGYTTTKIATEKITTHHLEKQIGISPLAGVCIVIAWLVVLVLLAVFHPQDAREHTLLSMFYTFYWIGSIIFGGGQVMLPMLLNDIVFRGWVTKEQFLAGFALIQSLPGPLFNISSYLGALLYGPVGALVAALGLFGPGVSLLFGLLPLWERVRDNQQLKIFLAGVNAAATGLVVASIFLLGEKAVHSNAGAAVALATGFMVAVFKVPTPLAIVTGGVIGYLLTPGVFNVGQRDFCSP